MISKKDIIKMAKRVSRKSRGHTDAQLVNPHREWFIGVFFFFIIAVTGGVINARAHVYYNTLENRIERTAVPVESYAADAVTDTIAIYSEREAQFEVLAGDVPATAPVVDTSTSSATTTTRTEEGAVFETETATSTERETPENTE